MPKVTAAVTSLLTVFALAASPAAAEPPAERAEPAVDGREILRRMDDLWRGESSAAMVAMHIKTEHWQRTLRLKAYSKGTEATLFRIVSPKQEAGTATLKVEDNIWNYLPRTRRVMKVPASMMMGSWMGSHFTNDDIVRESRLEEDYTFEVVEEDGETGGVYQLTLSPRPEAPVVWGRVVLEVERDSLMPLWQEYYDEEGALVRKAVFGDLRTLGDRRLPMRMRMTPAEAPDEFTEIVYEKLMFDVPLEDAFFSLQNLKR